MADSCLGSDATLSQPLIADPNQLPRYQIPEYLTFPEAGLVLVLKLHAAMWYPLPAACSAQLNWSDSGQFFKASICFWYLLKTTPLIVVTCTLLTNKDTIFLHASYPLHPIRGFFFLFFSFPFLFFFFSQSYLRVCGLPCQIGWVMKGYRKQPETWYWRHVIISDFKRACKLDFFFSDYLCYDNHIGVFTF